MDDKEYLTNKAFCPVPWTGLMYNFDGNIKTCIRSSDIIGNIQDNTIVDILVLLFLYMLILLALLFLLLLTLLFKLLAY